MLHRMLFVIILSALTCNIAYADVSLNKSSFVAGKSEQIRLIKTNEDLSKTDITSQYLFDDNQNSKYKIVYFNGLPFFYGLKKEKDIQLIARKKDNLENVIFLVEITPAKASKIEIGEFPSVVNHNQVVNLSVRSLDFFDNEVPGTMINWKTSDNESNSISDENGIAKLSLTMSRPGVNTIQVKIDGTSGIKKINIQVNKPATSKVISIKTPLYYEKTKEINIQSEVRNQNNELELNPVNVKISFHKNSSCTSELNSNDFSGIIQKESESGIANFNDIFLNSEKYLVYVRAEIDDHKVCSKAIKRKDLESTKFSFVSIPSRGIVGRPLFPSVRVVAKDSKGLIQKEVNKQISISIYSDSNCLIQSNNLTGDLSNSILDGYSQFSNLKIESSGVYFFKVTSDGVDSDCSGSSVAIESPNDNVSKIIISSLPLVKKDMMFSGPRVWLLTNEGKVIRNKVKTIKLSAYSDPECNLLSESTISGDSLVTSSSGYHSFSKVRFGGVGAFYLGVESDGIKECSTLLTSTGPLEDEPYEVVINKQPPAFGRTGVSLSGGVSASIVDISGKKLVTNALVNLMLFSDSNCSDPVLGVNGKYAVSNNGIYDFHSIYVPYPGKFHYKVYSGNLRSSCSTQVEGFELNLAPIIAEIENKKIQANSLFSLKPSVTDDDSGVISFGFKIFPHSAGPQIDSNGLITWTPSVGEIGEYSITYEATDRFGYKSEKAFQLSVVPSVKINKSQFVEGDVDDPLFVISIETKKPLTKIGFGSGLKRVFTPLTITAMYGLTSVAYSGKSGNDEITLGSNANGDIILSFASAVKFHGNDELDLTLSFSDGTSESYRIPVTVVRSNLPYLKYDIFAVDNGSTKGGDLSSIYLSIKEMKRVSDGWRTPIVMRFKQEEIYCGGYKVPGIYNETDTALKNCLRSKVSSDAETVFSFATVWSGSNQIGGIAKGVRNGVIMEKYPWIHTLAHELGHNLGLWHTFETYWNPAIIHCNSSAFESCYYYSLLKPSNQDDNWNYYGDFSSQIISWDNVVDFNFGSIIDDTPMDAFGSAKRTLNNLYEPFYSNYPYSNGNGVFLHVGGQNLNNQTNYLCQQYYDGTTQDWTMSCDATSGVSPSTDVMKNVMSYWRRKDKTSLFSSGQKLRMDSVLNSNSILTER